MYAINPFVEKVIRDHRVVVVLWTYNGEPHVSYLYHHTDGTWGADPAFMAESPFVRNAVLAKAMMVDTKRHRRASGDAAGITAENYYLQ